MVQSFSPTLALSNIEYICLLMRFHPGESQRWYLRRLHQYRFGTPGLGSFCAMYFSRRHRYRGYLFTDFALSTRREQKDCPLSRLIPAQSEMRLTTAGFAYAQRAMSKIGL